VEHLHQSALTAGLIVIMAFAAQSRASARESRDPERVSVLVRIDNMANVPADIVRVSEGRAAEVFGGIAVQLEWIDGQTANRDMVIAPYTVVLVSGGAVPGKAAKRGLVDIVVGEAAAAAHRAYVFYDRIAAMRVISPLDLASTLGDVIAHELGRLMLPVASHSASGIMRPGLELRPGRVGTFDERQARLIRGVIAAR
jgi:hypothetical protein